jgi:iron(II)-dependent oxidoreductase
MKMLAKTQEDRWKTVGEIRELLEKRTSLFITPESDIVAKMPSEMERIRRFEETQEVKRKEELRAKGVPPKAPPSRKVRRPRVFPWKPFALITLLIVIGGAAFMAYKYRVISLNKMALPDLKKIAPIGRGMVLIPEGEFLMGTTDAAAEQIAESFPKSKDSWIKDEKPPHRVSLKAFYIDRHEVTNGEYKKFVDATGHRAPFVEEEWAEEYNWENDTYPPGKEDHPVVLVSWDDARAYADWAGKRLPTEAEWEKAARGGLEGKLWPWGDEWNPEAVNSWESGTRGTQPVKSYPPNGYDLYDMAGNVWEWCADWYDSDYYQASPAAEPQGPDKGMNRPVRGGSWSNMSLTSRCAERKKMNPRTQFNSIGFRCVKDK